MKSISSADKPVITIGPEGIVSDAPEEVAVETSPGFKMGLRICIAVFFAGVVLLLWPGNKSAPSTVKAKRPPAVYSEDGILLSGQPAEAAGVPGEMSAEQPGEAASEQTGEASASEGESSNAPASADDSSHGPANP